MSTVGSEITICDDTGRRLKYTSLKVGEPRYDRDLSCWCASFYMDRDIADWIADDPKRSDALSRDVQQALADVVLRWYALYPAEERMT